MSYSLETLYGILGKGAYFRGDLLSEFYGILTQGHVIYKVVT